VEPATSSRHGFGVGDGLGLGLGLGDGDPLGDGVGFGLGDGDGVGLGDGWWLSEETQSPRFLNRTSKTAGYCCWTSLHTDTKTALLCPLLSTRLTHAPWLSPKSACWLQIWLASESAKAGVAVRVRGTTTRAAAPSADAIILSIILTFLSPDQSLW
jgi:hypothetical protein